MTWNDCARSTIWRVPVGGPGACVTGPSAASATPAVAQPALARATARRAGRNIWSPVEEERDDPQARRAGDRRRPPVALSWVPRDGDLGVARCGDLGPLYAG